jgi:hypothetical protein
MSRRKYDPNRTIVARPALGPLAVRRTLSLSSGPVRHPRSVRPIRMRGQVLAAASPLSAAPRGRLAGSLVRTKGGLRTRSSRCPAGRSSGYCDGRPLRRAIQVAGNVWGPPGRLVSPRLGHRLCSRRVGRRAVTTSVSTSQPIASIPRKIKLCAREIMADRIPAGRHADNDAHTGDAPRPAGAAWHSRVSAVA